MTVVAKTPKILIVSLIKCFLNMLSELISLFSCVTVGKQYMDSILAFGNI